MLVLELGRINVQVVVGFPQSKNIALLDIHIGHEHTVCHREPFALLRMILKYHSKSWAKVKVAKWCWKSDSQKIVMSLETKTETETET